MNLRYPAIRSRRLFHLLRQSFSRYSGTAATKLHHNKCSFGLFRFSAFSVHSVSSVHGAQVIGAGQTLHTTLVLIAQTLQLMKTMARVPVPESTPNPGSSLTSRFGPQCPSSKHLSAGLKSMMIGEALLSGL